MNVQVKTVELELRTAKLTKSILRQIPIIDWRRMTELGLLKADGNEQSKTVIGWVDGSVLGDDHKRWLIFKIEDGRHERYLCQASPDLRRVTTSLTAPGYGARVGQSSR